MTRALRALAAAGGLTTMVLTLFVTHLPAPSAVSEARRDDVYGVWHGIGEFAKRLPDLPAWLDPIRSDKTIHFVLFLVPAVAWSLAAGRRLDGRRGLLLFCVLASWSALDELSQHFTGRNGQWGDSLANLAGAATGIAIVWPLMRAWARRAPPRGAPAAATAPPRTGPGTGAP